MPSRRRAIALSLLVLSLLAVACGGSDAPDAGTTAAVETGPDPTDQASEDAAVASAEATAEDDAAVAVPAEAAPEDDAAVVASAEAVLEDDTAAVGGPAAAVTGAPVPPPTPGPVQAEASQTATAGSRFPPLNDPRVVLPAAATWLRDDTLVLGAVQNGDARAYPVFMMTFHHIANDVLGGEPYLVSF